MHCLFGSGMEKSERTGGAGDEGAGDELRSARRSGNGFCVSSSSCFHSVLTDYQKQTAYHTTYDIRLNAE